MHRFTAIAAALVLGSFPLSGIAAEPTAKPVSLAPNYALAADWICRPGAEDTCTKGLDAKVETPQGPGETLAFVPAKDPPIDCFYVYPTVSQEESTLSDLADSPEIQDVANRQAGHLTSRCRVFAPLYRQTTIAGLRKMMRGEVHNDDFESSFGDVEAAWEYYLEHDNNGRGVVLIGHSQGTILLHRLIAESIDGTSRQKLLVAAFLGGDPSLAVPSGKKLGGTFKHVPLCSSQAETGCAYAWGSYLDNDTSPIFRFGSPLDDGMTSACLDPAAPAGGTGMLKFFLKKAPTAPAADPPWVETLEQLSGKCRSDATGNGFIVSVRPGKNAARYKALLEDSEIVSGWGLHVLDIQLVMGNILDDVDAETATWTKGLPAAPKP